MTEHTTASDRPQMTMEQTFARIVDLARADIKGPANMGLKLMEEVGEYAECINFELGYLPHKKMKEPAIAEAADVIQNVMCILGALFPTRPKADLWAELEFYMQSKTDKWESVLVRKEQQPDFGDTAPSVFRG